MKKISAMDNKNFIHGDQYFRDIQNPLYDMSTNILDMSGEKDEYSTYPNVENEIRKIISEFTGFSTENIYPFYGMTSLIYTYYSVFNNSRVAFGEPLFSEHMRSAIRAGCLISRIPVKGIFRNPSMIKKYKINMFSTNIPVNPTGEYPGRNFYEKLFYYGRDIRIFIDEAYIDFLYHDGIPDHEEIIKENRNVFFGRSMTKILGKPGLRIGYLLSNKDNIRLFEKLSQPWTMPMSYPELLKDSLKNYPQKSEIKMVMEERKRLTAFIKSKGWEILGDSSVNFFSFRIPENKMDQFISKMDKYGISLRNCSNFYGFRETDFRLSIKSREANDYFINIVKGI
ncbi:aminotransferase class I/II-fold pyridoxal phosphate-dependent enzyme [Caldiplasma sukawensis]